ncbi:MotE family protein [Algirhabdus cladophorae]|uniref:MotE family protein n=1 Tax=Algirhabdus cladophorae TaxID=3377108 RepID=UPI003B8465F8
MKQRKTRKRTARGALTVIMILFLGSGAIRITGFTGQAFAREDALAPGTVQPTMPSVDVAAAISALSVREEKVAQTEKRVEARLKVLAAAEADFETSRAALIEAEEALADTIAVAETAMENDIAQLATVYEKMKPKDAAKLFAQMDPEFAAGFLARMKTDVAAAVLSGLDPAQAYTISVLLAGRNGNVPKE